MNKKHVILGALAVLGIIIFNWHSKAQEAQRVKDDFDLQTETFAMCMDKKAYESFVDAGGDPIGFVNWTFLEERKEGREALNALGVLMAFSSGPREGLKDSMASDGISDEDIQEHIENLRECYNHGILAVEVK
jgi:hypothetical protein